MSLDACVGVDLGRFVEHVVLNVDDGEVVAVIGPNGSGKTTLLRSLAGIQPMTTGQVRLDGEVLDDPVRRIHVPPEHRKCALVFQEQFLFPRLSVLDNVAFGPRCRGASRQEAARRAHVWLERLTLEDLTAVRPSELSGGQSQQVALARALASDPRLLLLDEPTSALDATQRGSVRTELRTHLRDFAGACVIVTHDPFEAAAVADRLMVLDGGRSIQSGTFAETVRRPESAFVAELMGRNLLFGHAEGRIVRFEDGPELDLLQLEYGPRRAVIVPSDIVLELSEPKPVSGEGSRVSWPTKVVGIDPLGDLARVRLGRPTGTSAVALVTDVAALGLTEGMSVWASVESARIDVFDSGTG